MTQRRSISERYRAGESLLDLASATGLCASTVRKIIMDDGVQMRPRGVPRGRRKGVSQREIEIVGRYNAGETLQHIGDFYGISRERVRQLLSRCGVARRRLVAKPKPKRPPMHLRDGRYVYFAVAECGLVKIGTSVMPEDRLESIAEWVPFKISLAATFPGSFDVEAALHGMFADEWMFGEWFKLSDRIQALITDVAEGRPFQIAESNLGNPSKFISGAKRSISSRLTWAEKHAGFEHQEAVRNRPDYVAAALKSFKGPHTPPPSADAVAVIEQYIELLRTTSDPARAA